jgi:ketosteroid isomerase-like protein
MSRLVHCARGRLAVAVVVAVALATLAACNSTPRMSSPTPTRTSTMSTTDLALLQQQVTAAERAFARSMAERDLAAFGRYLDEEALFFGGGQVLRGRAAVLDGWNKFFDGAVAPFSWEPDQVEVLASGDLAISSGPVRNPAGEVVARFNSIWRRDAQGRWWVVFDKGEPAPR